MCRDRWRAFTSCVVLRHRVSSVNLIVPEGLDTPTLHVKPYRVFLVDLIVPKGFPNFTYLVFTVVMLLSSEVLAVA